MKKHIYFALILIFAIAASLEFVGCENALEPEFKTEKSDVVTGIQFTITTTGQTFTGIARDVIYDNNILSINIAYTFIVDIHYVDQFECYGFTSVILNGDNIVCDRLIYSSGTFTFINNSQKIKKLGIDISFQIN